MTIGNRIKTIRNTMSQEDFGAKIGVSKFAISGYENGKRSATDRVISDICREFNVNEEWLRTGEGEMYAKDPERIIAELSQKFDMGALDKDIITSLANLPPDAQKSIADYIKFMANQYRSQNEKE